MLQAEEALWKKTQKWEGNMKVKITWETSDEQKTRVGLEINEKQIMDRSFEIEKKRTEWEEASKGNQ